MSVTNTYADVDQVQQYFDIYGLTFSTTTKPTTAEVERFLDQTAAKIDSILTARGYSTVPATGANDLLMLGMYTAIGAAIKTWYAGFGSDDLPAEFEGMVTEFDAFITDLKAGDMRLIDQTPARARMGTVLGARYIED